MEQLSLLETEEPRGPVREYCGPVRALELVPDRPADFGSLEPCLIPGRQLLDDEPLPYA